MTNRITLQQIRDHSPCRDGWTKLLKTLGNPSDLSITVSIGEIARSNGPQDALWCLRCAEFDRRDMVRAILPSVKRAATHTTGQRVADCITAIEGWIAGTVSVSELQKAARAAAYAAAYAAADAADAAYAADAAVRAAADAAADAADAAARAAYAAADTADTARASRAARAAAYAAADTAAYAAADTADTARAARAAADAAADAADAAETNQQIEDICAVFP